MWITTNRGKFLKRWEYQITTLPASLETFMQVKKQQLELDMKQETVSKLGEEYIKAIYCHPAYLTYMQSISREMLDWITSWIKTARRNIDKLRYADNSIFLAESEKGLKSLLIKRKEEIEKAGLSSTFKKQRSWHLVPSLHGK